MAMSNDANAKHSCVGTALSIFLRDNGIEDSTVAIDDIVLSYVISVLEELGTSSADGIDVDGFMEMMDAYYHGFSKIQQAAVVEWMFSLSIQLEASHNDPPSTEPLPSPPNTSKSSCSDKVSREVDVLLEMFPSLCRNDVRRCLRTSDGDLDLTIDTLVRRYSNLPCDDIKHRKELTKELINCNDDKSLRDKMVEKYAFEAECDQGVEYKPVIPKEAPKKLVRYRDGQIVNTRGERFTEVKKEETDEFKKTYINLKPARKYRFH